MEFLIGMFVVLFIAAVAYGIYCGVRLGTRVRRSVKNYLNS